MAPWFGRTPTEGNSKRCLNSLRNVGNPPGNKLLGTTELVRQLNHSLLERKRHVFDEQHATWDRLALDLRPVLQVLFLLLLSCFRLLDFGHFVRLSWPLHRRTPSLLWLGVTCDA